MSESNENSSRPVEVTAKQGGTTELAGKTRLELKELLPRIDQQFEDRLDTLKQFGFLTEDGKAKEGDVRPPSFEKAMNTFTPEELEIASHFQRPILLLIPETSLEAKVEALDSFKGNVQKYTRVPSEFKETDSGSKKITGWRAVIIEGAREMEVYEDDNIKDKLKERLENRKAKKKDTFLKGMDRHKYIMLTMEAMKNGDLIDQNNWTILEDDEASKGFMIPGAHVFDDELVFISIHPESVIGHSRFRSSVGGNVLLT